MFVPTTTSLIKVVNSGSLHWALSVFTYFRFTLTFGVHFAGDVNKKLLSVAMVRSRFPRPHPSEPELPSANKYFSKFNAYQNECFFETMDLHRTFEFQSNGCFAFKNNFKRTINCLVTRANMNESSTQRLTDVMMAL